MRPVAYFSAKLDPLVVGFPRCLRAVAAAEKAAIASGEIVGYSDLTPSSTRYLNNLAPTKSLPSLHS